MCQEEVSRDYSIVQSDAIMRKHEDKDSGVALEEANTRFIMPENEIPDNEMSGELAHRLIQDDLSFDCEPSRNLGTFVTTYMEKEAENLIMSGLNKNFINHESYPAIADTERRCVNMIARLFHAPNENNCGNAVGTSTVGSSEAILLATLAMKKRWIKRQKLAGRDCSSPNLIVSSAVQVCWKKAARYFDIEEKYVHCSSERYVIDPSRAVDLVDENTIGICSIMGTTYTGEYEDTKAINDLLVERNLDVPIHVDAASGGFVAPFLTPDLAWDFRLEKVVSINVSGHKYGLVYAGIGWVIWRDATYLPKELVFSHHYLGTEQASFTLSFSRGASHILCQYYNLIRLGKRGYSRVMFGLLRTAEHLASILEKMGCFTIVSQRHGNGLPLVAFRLKTTARYNFDEFAIAEELHQKGGWIVPAYTMAVAPGSPEVRILRVVVREDFTAESCDAFIIDVRKAVQRLTIAHEDTYVEAEEMHMKPLLGK